MSNKSSNSFNEESNSSINKNSIYYSSEEEEFENNEKDLLKREFTEKHSFMIVNHPAESIETKMVKKEEFNKKDLEIFNMEDKHFLFEKEINTSKAFTKNIFKKDEPKNNMKLKVFLAKERKFKKNYLLMKKSGKSKIKTEDIEDLINKFKTFDYKGDSKILLQMKIGFMLTFITNREMFDLDQIFDELEKIENKKIIVENLFKIYLENNDFSNISFEIFMDFLTYFDENDFENIKIKEQDSLKIISHFKLFLENKIKDIEESSSLNEEEDSNEKENDAFFQMILIFSEINISNLLSLMKNLYDLNKFSQNKKKEKAFVKKFKSILKIKKKQKKKEYSDFKTQKIDLCISIFKILKFVKNENFQDQIINSLVEDYYNLNPNEVNEEVNKIFQFCYEINKSNEEEQNKISKNFFKQFEEFLRFANENDINDNFLEILEKSIKKNHKSIQLINCFFKFEKENKEKLKPNFFRLYEYLYLSFEKNIKKDDYTNFFLYYEEKAESLTKYKEYLQKSDFMKKNIIDILGKVRKSNNFFISLAKIWQSNIIEIFFSERSFINEYKRFVYELKIEIKKSISNKDSDDLFHFFKAIIEKINNNEEESKKEIKFNNFKIFLGEYKKVINSYITFEDIIVNFCDVYEFLYKQTNLKSLQTSFIDDFLYVIKSVKDSGELINFIKILKIIHDKTKYPEISKKHRKYNFNIDFLKKNDFNPKIWEELFNSNQNIKDIDIIIKTGINFIVDSFKKPATIHSNIYNNFFKFFEEKKNENEILNNIMSFLYLEYKNYFSESKISILDKDFDDYDFKDENSDISEEDEESDSSDNNINNKNVKKKKRYPEIKILCAMCDLISQKDNEKLLNIMENVENEEVFKKFKYKAIKYLRKFIQKISKNPNFIEVHFFEVVNLQRIFKWKIFQKNKDFVNEEQMQIIIKNKNNLLNELKFFQILSRKMKTHKSILKVHEIILNNKIISKSLNNPKEKESFKYNYKNLYLLELSVFKGFKKLIFENQKINYITNLLSKKYKFSELKDFQDILKNFKLCFDLIHKILKNEAKMDEFLEKIEDKENKLSNNIDDKILEDYKKEFEDLEIYSEIKTLLKKYQISVFNEKIDNSMITLAKILRIQSHKIDSKEFLKNQTKEKNIKIFHSYLESLSIFPSEKNNNEMKNKKLRKVIEKGLKEGKSFVDEQIKEMSKRIGSNDRKYLPCKNFLKEVFDLYFEIKEQNDINILFKNFESWFLGKYKSLNKKMLLLKLNIDFILNTTLFLSDNFFTKEKNKDETIDYFFESVKDFNNKLIVNIELDKENYVYYIKYEKETKNINNSKIIQMKEKASVLIKDFENHNEQFKQDLFDKEKKTSLENFDMSINHLKNLLEILNSNLEDSYISSKEIISNIQFRDIYSNEKIENIKKKIKEEKKKYDNEIKNISWESDDFENKQNYYLNFFLGTNSFNIDKNKLTFLIQNIFGQKDNIDLINKFLNENKSINEISSFSSLKYLETIKEIFKNDKQNYLKKIGKNFRNENSNKDQINIELLKKKINLLECENNNHFTILIKFSQQYLKRNIIPSDKVFVCSKFTRLIDIKGKFFIIITLTFSIFITVDITTKAF